jgi:hypothetical protein
MNFRKLYERAHLREDSQINLEGVKFFVDGKRSDYSYPSFKEWWSKRKDNLSGYYMKDAPWAVPEFAYYPTAKAVATVHILGSYSKEELESFGLNSDPNDPEYEKATGDQAKLLSDYSNHRDSLNDNDKKAYFRERVAKDYPGLIENADKWREEFPKQFDDMFDDVINLLQHEADNILGNKKVSTNTDGKDPNSGANPNWKMTSGTWKKDLKDLFGNFSAHSPGEFSNKPRTSKSKETKPVARDLRSMLNSNTKKEDRDSLIVDLIEKYSTIENREEVTAKINAAVKKVEDVIGEQLNAVDLENENNIAFIIETAGL